jgi:sodium-independent sulfate anion transporter 11
MSGNRIKMYLREKIRKTFDASSEKCSDRTASLEHIARETINQTYLEDDPSVAEWICGLVPSSADVADYVSELFPSARWTRRYNLHWLAGDIVAGTFWEDARKSKVANDV